MIPLSDSQKAELVREILMQNHHPPWTHKHSYDVQFPCQVPVASDLQPTPGKDQPDSSRKSSHIFSQQNKEYAKTNLLER